MTDELTDPYEKKAREIADSVLHGKFYFPALVPAIASALEEAYKAGRESEATMWELARAGQEIDMCHDRPEQVGQSVSAQAPLQTASGREAQDAVTVATITAARAGLPADVQELLIYGNASQGIPAGILEKMLVSVSAFQTGSEREA